MIYLQCYTNGPIFVTDLLLHVDDDLLESRYQRSFLRILCLSCLELCI